MPRAKSRLAAAVIIAAQLACTSPLPAAEKDEMLSLLRAGHNSSLQAIRTLQCSVTWDCDPPDRKKSVRGRLWRTEKAIRIHERWENGQVKESLIRDSDAVSYSASAGDPLNSELASGLRSTRAGIGASINIWTLFFFPGDGSSGESLVPFDAFLAQANKGLKIRWVTEEGRRLIHLEVVQRNLGSVVDMRKEFWFDPDLGFFDTKRMESWEYKGTKCRSVTENSGFEEAAPGIHFPKICLRRDYQGDRQVAGSLWTISGIRVNEPIEAGVMTLRFPYGMRLWDKIEGKRILVNESGGTIQVLENAPAREVETPQGVAISPFTSQTGTDDVSWTRWILYGSVALFALALVGWLMRRWRAARADSM